MSSTSSIGRLSPLDGRYESQVKGVAACLSEQALIAMVDDLVDRRTISNAMWSALTAHFDEAQILEAIALAGYYHTISFLCRGLALPLEPWAAGFLTGSGGASPG